nr:hypothetical protein [uncultured Acidovorax sp.]
MTAFRALLALMIALSGGLAWMWVAPSGQLRSHAWTPPAPITPDMPAPKLPAGLETKQAAGVGAYVAILDRPLFAPDRRPPPPPDAAPEAPKPDPLAGLTLYGIFKGPDFSGIVARVNDKVRRVRLNEALGEWTVQSIEGREVTFVRGDETRSVRLVHVFGPQPPAVAGSSPPVAASPSIGGRPDLVSIQQQEQEAARERLRQRNELFRKAGLPPVKE